MADNLRSYIVPNPLCSAMNWLNTRISITSWKQALGIHTDDVSSILDWMDYITTSTECVIHNKRNPSMMSDLNNNNKTWAMASIWITWENLGKFREWSTWHFMGHIWIHSVGVLDKRFTSVVPGPRKLIHETFVDRNYNPGKLHYTSLWIRGYRIWKGWLG